MSVVLLISGLCFVFWCDLCFVTSVILGFSVLVAQLLFRLL